MSSEQLTTCYRHSRTTGPVSKTSVWSHHFKVHYSYFARKAPPPVWTFFWYQSNWISWKLAASCRFLRSFSQAAFKYPRNKSDTMAGGFSNVYKQVFSKSGYTGWYSSSITYSELVRAGGDPTSFISAGSPHWNQPWHKPLTSLGKRVTPAEGTCRKVLPWV